MHSNAQKRKRKIAWPDKRRWSTKFRQHLQADKTARAAFQKLMLDGCLWGNLMSFLYAYTFSSITVFREHSRRRDVVLEGLKAVAGRLDRATIAMQRTLDTEWWSEPTFASFLQERCRFDFQAVSENGIVTCGKSAPDFAVHLPVILKSYSTGLKRLRKELQKPLSARQVGKAFYLAEFATYIEAVTKQPIPWSVIAELVNAAQPENWKDKQVDPSLLQKNFTNFTSRNEELYRETRAAVAEYLATCALLPEKERPTLIGWTLKRRTANKPSS
jgi:hypothetical protein